MIELKGPEVKVSGAYEIHIVRADGKCDKVAAFDNLITNAGLDHMRSYGIHVDQCGVGSGSAEPAFTDTALQSPIGARTSNTGSYSFSHNSSGGFNEIAKSFTFPLGGIVGTVREVIVARTSSEPAISRALVKDGLGNPIGIAVQADEQLIVTWKARIYYPTADFVGSFTLQVNGVSETYGYSIRAYGVQVSSGYWGGNYAFGSMYQHQILLRSSDSQISATATNYPAESGSGSAVLDAYINGSFQRTATLSFTIGDANFAGGIGGIQIWGPTFGSIANSGLSAVFTPKIPKNSGRTLTLNVRVGWGRA